MKKKELQAIAQAAAKNIKTEDDLNEFRAMLLIERSDKFNHPTYPYWIYRSAIRDSPRLQDGF